MPCQWVLDVIGSSRFFLCLNQKSRENSKEIKETQAAWKCET